MYAFTYFQVNLSCIAMMAVVLLRNMRSLNQSRSVRTFSWLVGAMIVYSVFDMICGLSENDALRLNQLAASIANIGFFYASFAVAYLSFLFAQYELETKLTRPRAQLLCALPLLALTLVTPLTLKWRFFFYIDEAGNYVKGPLYALMLVLYYGYVLAVGVQSLALLGNKRYYAKRRKLAALASFVIFPLIAGVLQAMFTGISIICMGGTIAMVQVFINIQDTRITLDALTQLANREKLMQYLDARIGGHARASRGGTWLMMMDLDGFKEINDACGHVEGDAALRRVAAVLREEFGCGAGLIARYGGDEFCIVMEDCSRDEVEAYCARVRARLADAREAGARGYPLHFSAGVAELASEIATIPDFIDRADREMYRKKGGRG